MTDTRESVLITVEALADRLADPAGVVVLDISDDLEASPLDRPVIPGALAVSLASDISGPATKEGGRRPLPDPAELQQTLRDFGINGDSLVVVYDDVSGSRTGRAWWTLRWAGHNDVRLLDGGLGAWTDAGHDTAPEPAAAPGGGTIEVSPGGMPVIDADQAAEIARNGALLDARGRKAYDGDPANPATGHIRAHCAPARKTCSMQTALSSRPKT